MDERLYQSFGSSQIKSLSEHESYCNMTTLRAPNGATESIDEAHCTEQEIEEGTCGYGEDGKIENKPAGPHLMRERFKKLANIVK